MTSPLVLGPILRHVTTTTATIWVECSHRGVVEVVLDQGAHRRRFAASTFMVEAHHFALVVLDGLEARTVYPYAVEIDGVTVWPLPQSALPAPTLRTLGNGPSRMLFGSCRAAAPHEPPYSLELDNDDRGRGVDALRAHGLEMLHQDRNEWPDLIVMLGDQVYADDPSPRTTLRMRLHRHRNDPAPPDVVAGFEEYTSLYHESWTPEIERWMLSVVPSTMVFDDHDMIDDWNISDRWVEDIRREPWWQEHVVGALMSYWIYQHLGNLSPERIAEEGMLEQLVAVDDGTELLRRWALASEAFTPVPGGYQFSYHRDLGDVRLIVIDSRNGRVLDPNDRRIVDDDEWAWITDRASEPCRHLLLASSLPVLVPGGLHDFQSWNEALCAGRWGQTVARFGERLRRALDLEDWAAFPRSFDLLCDLLTSIGEGRGGDPPETILMLSGDIHFAYVAGARFPTRPAVKSRIVQIVNSPMRNALVTRERRVIRFALGKTGRRIGRWMRRSIHADTTPLVWELEEGPFFANNIGQLDFGSDRPRLRIHRAHPDADGAAVLTTVVDRTV